MPWYDRKPDPWYAIRTRKGLQCIVYRVSFTRHGPRQQQIHGMTQSPNARPST
jgi:hypothetical protein